MKIISHREHHEQTVYNRTFRWADNPGAGFGFPCDEDGNVTLDNPAAVANWNMCLLGVSPDGRKILDIGISSWVNSWVEPAVGICDVCGAKVELDGFTCTCDECGAEYNSSGQRLSDRSCWGEETGEHPADIGRIR